MSLCYMCDEPSTSIEHVPPKCLFPERKDVAPGQDFRKSLLTVPSCELHNSAKSHDDEYLLYCLVLSLPSNKVAENQFLTKVSRSIKRKPKLIKELSRNSQPVFVENMFTGEWSQNETLEVDFERMEACFIHIAYGLHFFHFKEKWDGKVSVHPNFMMSFDPVYHNHNQLVRKMDLASEVLFKGVDELGENKEVFTYKVINKGYSRAIRMNFYGGNSVTAVFNSNG